MSDFKDAYFFDREMAKTYAMQQNKVITSGATALQICYYDGQPFELAPRNLINVPFEKLVDFFTNTGLRLPIDFVGTSNEDKDKAMLFLELLKEIVKIRGMKANCYANLISNIKPDFRNDTPWRIAFCTRIYTDVWQYCMKNLAKEFQQKGYIVKVIIEKDDLHENDAYILRKHLSEFKPHIVVTISNEVPNLLNTDTYLVSWWQDIPNSYRTVGRINWRDRDLIFAQAFVADEFLKRTGAKNVQRQGIGVDNAVYRLMPDVKRERKVVFIGSSYIEAYNYLPKCNGDNDILNVIDKLLETGNPITKELAESLGEKYHIPSSLIFERHAAYLLRERVIEWLCQNKEIKVEIYGRYWDQNPIVKPFFKGELPHGEPVARVYNEAMYAISAVPANVTIQRVVEMAACGCIPVVYDSRHIAEKPHWDNECLFFRSREELYDCFDKAPVGNPIDIGKADSYDSFAEKILSIIREREGCTGL